MGISAESIQDKESEWVAGDTIIKQMAGVGIFQYAFNLSSKVLDFDWIFVQLGVNIIIIGKSFVNWFNSI